MSKTTAILGKSSVGKTFLATHLGMAFGYLGDKTLVVGCDQKRDALRALTREARPSLMEALERVNFDCEQVELADVVAQISEYVDVLELGPSQLLVGHYAGVLDEAFHFFELREVFRKYTRILFDVNDERFDSAYAPLFRRVEGAVAVTDDTPESLFVLNRLLRAVLIGGADYGMPMHIVGVVLNRSLNPLAFERYVERTRIFPILTIPESADLAALRPFHRTLFSLQSPPPHLERITDGLLKTAELLRGNPLNLYPVVPLDDDEIWQLPPPATLTN